jgi:hypothetical protein
MPIYVVTGYSPVPGDCCYVEAESRDAAIAIVETALQDGEEASEIDVSDWEVLEYNRPFFLIIHRD